MLVFCVTTTSGVTQKCVSEALLLNEPPFVYLLWKIHSLTWDNISLTFLLLSLFSSFLTATPRKFQELSPENVLVCRFKEWSRNGLQNTFFFLRYAARSHEISSSHSNPRALKVELGTTLSYARNKTQFKTPSLSPFHLLYIRSLLQFFKDPCSFIWWRGVGGMGIRERWRDMLWWESKNSNGLWKYPLRLGCEMFRI
jgi:hypothetical protein